MTDTVNFVIQSSLSKYLLNPGENMSDDNLPAESKPVDLTIVDEKLVKKAFDEIKEIYHDKEHDLTYSIGKCLLKHFYGNDLNNVRENLPTDGKSLNKLANECSQKIAGLSRAWLYASVNLLIDQEDLKDCIEYQQLNISLKFQLLSVKDAEKKAELAAEFINQNLPVRKAVKQIQNYNQENPHKKGGSKNPRGKSLGSLIKNPSLLTDPNHKKLATVEAISKLKDNTKKELYRQSVEKLNEIEEDLRKQKENKHQLQLVINNFKSAVPGIDSEE